MQAGNDGQGKMFEAGEEPVTPAEPRRKGRPRLMEAERYQMRLLNTTLDAVISSDHRVRQVWRFVEGLDLSELYERIDAVEGRAGHPAIDPKILLALWLYATVEDIGSARALDRLCEEHLAYQWLCGGVSVNYHTLADFRTAHRAILDRLLTQSVAVLAHEGIVELGRVAQDGVKVRASAGAATFRRRGTLQECLKEARRKVDQLRRDLDVDPKVVNKRQQAARKRVDEEREQQVGKALAELEKIEEKKKSTDEKEKARASTTDPEARVMKMADGGYRPAFNVQFATDTKTQVIVGVDVTNSGGDYGKMPPMVEQLHERYGEYPEEYLVDGGFAKKEDIETVSHSEIGCIVYAPVQKAKDPNHDPHQPHPRESDILTKWRGRMATEEAKTIYKLRAATAECVNATARNRGLRQFLVRGLEKVKAVALWFALAHNMMRTIALRPSAVT